MRFDDGHLHPFKDSRLTIAPGVSSFAGVLRFAAGGGYDGPESPETLPLPKGGTNRAGCTDRAARGAKDNVFARKK